MDAGIVTLDLHGKTQYQAQVAVDSLLRRAGAGTYRLRLIHGYHCGTALQEQLAGYARHPKVRRVLVAPDGGVTELILREF
ncbi:MAG: hypothetical protein RRY95_03635 [Oscillospiraceae bacterium]